MTVDMAAPLQLSIQPRPIGEVVVESRQVCNPFLEVHHYLGRLSFASLWLALFDDDGLTQCQAWKPPTARLLPSDGTVLELARWCIGPRSKVNAGSWFNARAVRIIRQIFPAVRTLVSYSELGHHSGGLYRASNWEEWATHHADRYRTDGIGYPSGHGSWDGITTEAPKLRWRLDL